MIDPAAPPLSAPTKRPAIFYGWWIVLAGLIAQFVSIGTQGPVSGAFLAPMTSDLGWDRGQFTIATSLSTAISGVVGFAIGGHIDRHGARPLMLVGTTILGASLIATAWVDGLWQFIILRGVVTTFGFVLIGNLVVNVAIAKWFVQHRGWAISIASLGVSLSSVVITPVMVRVVDVAGWREGWIVLGVASLLLTYPAALLMRRQPEDYGLLPDGVRAGDAGAAARMALADADLRNSFTRAEAVRTAALWMLVAAFGLSLMGLVSILFHAIPFLTDAGFSRPQAAVLFSAQGVSALLSKFVWGWWMQHVHARVLAAFSFVCSGVGVALMLPAAHAGSFEAELAAFLLFGWGIGGTIPLGEFIWASFFGRRHLGAVRAAALPVTIIFSAAGPYLAGLYFDVVGSYDGIYLAFVAMWAAATLLVLLARAPSRPVSARVQPAPSIRIPARPAALPDRRAAPRGDRPPAASTLPAPARPAVAAPAGAPVPVEAVPAPRWRAPSGERVAAEQGPAVAPGFRGFEAGPALPVVTPVRPVAVVAAPLEVSLGQVGHAVERRLARLTMTDGRELLPVVAVGAAASVVAIAAVMLLRRGQTR